MGRFGHWSAHAAFLSVLLVIVWRAPAATGFAIVAIVIGYVGVACVVAVDFVKAKLDIRARRRVVARPPVPLAMARALRRRRGGP